MVKQQKWNSVKHCYSLYVYNVRHQLSVRDSLLLYDDRVVIPKQLRPTLMDALHLTHPGQGGMLEAAKPVWYPYLHRDIVATAQNCKNCRDKGKNLKIIPGKKHYTTLDAVVEPNEIIQLNFTGPLQDDNDKEVYILVGVDRFSRFPYAKVSNNRADTIIRLLQNHIVNYGVRVTSDAITHKVSGPKSFLIICKTNSTKLIFAPVDEHRAMGMVERLIRTLKSLLAIMKIDKNNKPYKLASNVAELIKALRITPNATTKVTPSEAHFRRQPNTSLTNFSQSRKLSNLSWENNKLSCLDEKVDTKPALTAEAMCEKNSEDELDLIYKDTGAKEAMAPKQKDHQYLPEPTLNPVENEIATTANDPQGPTCTSPDHNPGKPRAKIQPEPINQHDTMTLESSDDNYDQQLLKKFR